MHLVNCKKHGESPAYLSRKRLRCKKCNVEKVTIRRRKVKLKAIEYKGGRCEICGYDKCAGAFDFHHKDPNEKDFAISHNGHSRSWERVKKEIDKCMLLCANCHREIHS
jgi:hypothetical protein